jgi:ribose transport system ATP-binding protein
MQSTILSIQHLTKHYPGVIALKDVSIDFNKGEVHALVGENGAGKSTLIKIISGAIEPDEGRIILESESFSGMNPHLAKEKGIEVIYQEFNLVGSLTAAENIFLGEKKKGLVNFREMERKATEIFQQFSMSIDPRSLVEDLSPAQCQIIEIAKAISRNAKIIIMDEPSAPLTVSEVTTMFEIVRTLKSQGVTVIYISHRLDEIFELADRVTVLRDGRFIGTKDLGDTNRQELVKMMVGRTLSETFPTKGNVPKDIALELSDISGNGVYNISLTVKKGEILGLSGLVGAGRTELAHLIFGVMPISQGTIRINQLPVRLKNPTHAISRGIGLIPEDRKHQGCILEMDIRWNISIAHIKQLSKNLVVDIRKEDELAEYYRELLQIKTPNLDQKVKNLSGGNQQKVVLAKTLATDSDIIIFDEPTRGIDVGAKQEIYQLMSQLAEQDKAIIMISSEMEELMGMADRILVLSEGRITGELERSEFDQATLLELASASH